MKLSKITFQWLVYHALHSDAAVKIIEEIDEALKKGTLEIEGYECNQWTKFDPNDPKTLPACNSEWFLIAAQKPIEPPTFTMMAERATQTLLEEIRRDIIKFRLNVYWRPLSKPPTEMEARK